MLDNLSNGYKKNIEKFIGLPNFEFIEGDITNFETCKKIVQSIDFISHQAALGSVPRSIENPLATHEANATGFLNILTAAKDSKVKRIVFASSSSVYGDSKELPKVEEKIGTQLSPYAVSKRTKELYANVFALTYGLDVVGLRYFNVFGPNQSPNGPYAAAIPLFMDAVLKNKSFMVVLPPKAMFITFPFTSFSVNKALMFACTTFSTKVKSLLCSPFPLIKGDSFFKTASINNGIAAA